jgi:Flp pilus assembly protein TadG
MKSRFPQSVRRTQLTSEIASRRGAVAVELALALPLLFFFIFGAYEFGRANMLRHTAEAAAYEGARVGIVPGASAAEVEASVKRLCSTVGIRNLTVDVEPKVLDRTNGTVSVTVTVPLQSNMLIAPAFLKNAEFRRNCKLLREKL